MSCWSCREVKLLEHAMKNVERVLESEYEQGMRKLGAVFFCTSAKILPLPLPHRLFDLKSNLAKKFYPFPDVD